MPRVRLLHFVPIELEANDIRKTVPHRLIRDDVEKLAPTSILPVRHRIISIAYELLLCIVEDYVPVDGQRLRVEPEQAKLHLFVAIRSRSHWRRPVPAE